MGTSERDVLDLRRAREQAELAHDQLRSLFDSAPEGIFIADSSGQFTDVNPAGCRLVGYSREELLGMRVVDVISAEDVPRLEPHRQQLLAGSEIVGEWLLRRRDGTHVPVELSTKILGDGRWQAFVRDMTARKDLESALRAKSADLERAQSVAKLGSWRFDLQRNEVHLSDEGHRIFGTPTGVPLTYEQFLAIVHPDDRSMVDRAWTAALAGAPYDIEHRVIVDRAVKWLREKAELEYDAHGSVVTGIGTTQDITERRRLEAEVEQANEWIEIALKSADLAAWDWNIVTGEVLLDARWATMRGYTGNEVRPLVEAWDLGIHPDDVERVHEALEAHFAGAVDEYECEFRVETATGSWIWVLDRGRVFTRNAQGEPIRMLGALLDITKHKQADNELRLAHETTSGILAMSPDAIISIDEQQRITMFNEGAENIFGYTKAEAIGMPLDRLMPERFRAPHRDQVEHFASGPNTTRQLDRAHPPLLGLRKNGEEFIAESAISKLEVGGHKVLTATIRDVTEQRRVEHEQRFLAEAGALLASSLDYETTLDRVAGLAVRELADLCVIDLVTPEGKIQRFKAICRQSDQQWIGDLFMRVTLDMNRPFATRMALIEREPQLIEQLTEQMLDEFRQSPDHERVIQALSPKSLISVPLLVHGKLLGAIALVASASSRRFGRADLLLANELARLAALAIESARLYATAQRAIQARDDVLGIVAHDLRNPLNAISLYADVLEQNAGEDRKTGQAIRTSVMRMNRLIQDLLDVTRLDAGQLKVDRRRVSTLETLLDLVEVQRPLAEARNIALLLEVSADVPDVLADHDRLLQICENLIGNALKFTQHGSVTIGAAPRTKEVLFWITDTGTGLAEEALPHLFDRFWQTGAEVRQGAGLGLAIVKALVEIHGGRIWVESTLGSGTTFYFTIPQAPSVEAWEPAPAAAQ